MRKGHSGHAHVEEFFHRQLAARVAQADHDAVDLQCLDERRNIVHRTDNPGVHERLSHPRRVGVDKSDDRHAQLGLSLVKLPRQLNGGVVCAHDQHALAGTGLLARPLECQPPPDRHEHDQHCRDDEDAAADDEGGKQEVESRHDERCGAKRLQRAYKELAPVGDDPQVVEVGVVEAGLAPERYHEGFQQAPVNEEHITRVASKTDPGGKGHG